MRCIHNWEPTDIPSDSWNKFGTPINARICRKCGKEQTGYATGITWYDKKE